MAVVSSAKGILKILKTAAGRKQEGRRALPEIGTQWQAYRQSLHYVSEPSLDKIDGVINQPNNPSNQTTIMAENLNDLHWSQNKLVKNVRLGLDLRFQQ